MLGFSFFRGLLNTGGTLFQRVIQGGFWVTVSSTGERLLGLIRTIVLARLLLPEDFGLLGIALTLISGVHAFTITGLRAAIIQRKDVDDVVLSTAWLIGVIRGVILCGFLVAAAPVAAYFFNEPRVTPIIQLLALNQIFKGLQNVGLFLLDKELDFKQRTYFDLWAGVLTTTVSITAAFILQNVWALVIGEMAGSIIRLILSYRIQPFRPRFRFDKKIAKELFDFGKHILSTRVILFFLLQGDDVAVGKFLGTGALGHYTLAYQLANLPATAISGSIASVTLPAYAKKQDDPKALRSAYLRTVSLLGLIALPASAILILIAPELVETLYGETWLPMVPAMQVLCIFGLFRVINTTFGSLYQGLGHPDKLRNFTFWQFVFLIAIIYPCLLMWDLIGVGIAVTLANILVFVLAVRGLPNILPVGFTDLVRGLYAPLLATCIASFCTWVLLTLMSAGLILTLILGGISFGLFYLLFLWLIKPNLVGEIRTIVEQVKT